MRSTLSDAEVPSSASRPLEALQRECEEVGRTAPGDTQKMASLLSQMSLSYYQDVRRQAQQSFGSALVAALIGIGFFVYAAWLIMEGGYKTGSATLPLIAGALVQIISGINFLLYGRAARQFAAFHICLERTNRFLLANTLCENLACPTQRDRMRSQLICIVANAPMLTLEVIAGESDKVPPKAVQDPTSQHLPVPYGAEAET
ncbi:MAG: hypothetical protein ABW277_14030 [Longimicrobiaceae bacterium]